ncbi:MAG TPA: site-2 protease family protein [Anaeromyxobacteraceae bacterium]|nr:site-2 protease family protein [Anaeromyxobacteraceae bacterium]
MGRTGASIQVGRIGGIPIRLHLSFLVVLPFIAWAFGAALPYTARLAGIAPAALAGPRWAWGLGLAIALFLSVLVHELAHSAYAVAHGGKVRGITLLMIGGVSEVLEPPRTPGQEAMMAFLGPATSLALACFAFAGYLALRPAGVEVPGFVLFHLAYVNFLLAAFNLLPAFPMDGGRILRGLLARRIGLERATGIAATVGQLFAIAFGVWGFVSANLVLVLVALFVFFGAEAESRDVGVREALAELRLRELLARDVGAVDAEERLSDVGARMLAERRLAYPVLDDGTAVGVVTLESVEDVEPALRTRTRVRDRVRRAVLGPEARADEALRVMDREGVGELAVADGAALLGTVSRGEITRALRLRALARPQHGGGRRLRRRAPV